MQLDPGTAAMLRLTLSVASVFAVGLAPAQVATGGASAGKAAEIQVPPPPFSEGIFPCSDCHGGLPTNRARRPVTDHEDVRFAHDPEHLWCLDCHNPDDRDKLRLASGQLVEFTESYKLCGQCHGEKLRDWKAGVHGRRTGSWNGTKQYLLCAHCHNPHSPRFAPIRPEPPPVRPERLLK